jgi:hypothetical protein
MIKPTLVMKYVKRKKVTRGQIIEDIEGSEALE